MMRIASISFSLLCLITIANSQDSPRPQNRITIDEVIAAEVVGHIGVPMGECARIRATISRAGKNKADSGRYELTITHVNGIPLNPIVVSRFKVHQFATEEVRLANDWFSLYELKMGEKAKRVSSEQIKKMEEGYLGSSVELLAYETGAFDGIPTNLPEDMVTWQGTGFRLFTEIVVMDQYR